MIPTAHHSKGCQRHRVVIGRCSYLRCRWQDRFALFRGRHNFGKLPNPQPCWIFGLGMLAIRLGLGIRILQRS